MNDADKYATLLDFDIVLGLGLADIPAFHITDEAKTLIEKRDNARTNKDYVQSDELRKELEALGYEVLDTANGTVLG